MRRSKQALPEEECLRILACGYRGFLSVIGDGGYPYTVPINFVFEDGKLYFHCAKEGHKLDALRACDKACFTVLDEPPTASPASAPWAGNTSPTATTRKPTLSITAPAPKCWNSPSTT